MTVIVSGMITPCVPKLYFHDSTAAGRVEH